LPKHSIDLAPVVEDYIDDDSEEEDPSEDESEVKESTEIKEDPSEDSS